MVDKGSIEGFWWAINCCEVSIFHSDEGFRWRSLVRKKFRWGAEEEIICFQSMIVMHFSGAFYDMLKFSSIILPIEVGIKKGVIISFPPPFDRLK